MKNCAIYSSNFDLDQVVEIIEKLNNKETIWISEDRTQIRVISKKWFSKTENTFNIMTSKTHPEEFPTMINGMGNFFRQVPAKNETVHKKLLLKIATLNMVIGIETEKDISDKLYAEILDVARQLDGIVFMGTRELLDYNGKLILDIDGNSEVDDFIVTAHTSFLHSDLKITESGMRRKERSEKILSESNIPVNKSLPVICGDEDAVIRDVNEIAKRAIALCIVALKGECHGTNHDLEDTRALITRIINQYNASEFLSPKERLFIENDYPDMEDVVYFSWCYEGYLVMLWALGYVDELEYPSSICNVPAAVAILKEHETYADFIAHAQMRRKDEILDAADLIYRYDWVCVDSRINNRPVPGELDDGVVYERHRALNWLITYMEQEWDQVTTDT